MQEPETITTIVADLVKQVNPALNPDRQVPSVGRIVHYVSTSGRHPGEHRPAIIVKVWGEANPDSLVQLQVFTDSANDFDSGQLGYNGLFWATLVAHDEDEKKQGTWHWPEFVPRS